MRQILLLLLDLLLIFAATIGAVVLRENLDLSSDRLWAVGPYVAFTMGLSLVTLPLLGTHRSVWRYSANPDYRIILPATAVIVAGSLALGFAFNRMDGIPRTLPILQAILIPVALIGARLARRALHAWLDHRSRPAPSAAGVDLEYDTVLILGLSRLTHLYIRAAAQFTNERVRIAGLLAESAGHVGNNVAGKRILGTADNLSEIIRDLEIHGVFVTRIVVASPVQNLSGEARAALREIEDGSGIRVEHLLEQLGLAGSSAAASKKEASKFFDVGADGRASLATRHYWRFRRALDIAGASALLVILAPLIPFLAVLIAVDVGMPVTFWQQRPGLNGRPFKLYKFRTMMSAHDQDGNRVPDEERSSRIGRFLRLTRLDELPQLYNILVGEMSFIGPRPLLPVDQPAAYSDRLLIRPGLTGWAQVMGGREISATDKAALDVWYVRNADLWLDVQIVFHTVRMVVFGEKIEQEAIRIAWDDLRRSGVCMDESEQAPGDLLEKEKPEYQH